jgi:hypothetical protein
LFSALLSIVHYLGLQNLLVYGLNQPIEVYLSVLVSLILFKIAKAVYRLWPAIRRLLNSVQRLHSRVDSLYSRLEKSNGSPFKQGGKRSMSTSSKQPLPRRGGNVSSSLAKDNKGKTLYHSTLLRLHFNIENFQGLFSVKGGRRLVNIFKGLLIMAGARITPGIIRYICLFIVHCRNIFRTQGVKGLTKYLKASGVILQQSLGLHVVHDTGKLGARVSKTRGGLPRFIPPVIRNHIRSDHFVYIKCTQSLIQVYRVFEYTGAVNLKTITAPNKGSGGLDHFLYSWIPRFLKLFVFDRFRVSQIGSKLLKYSQDSVFAMFKGGPGVIGSLGWWNTMPYALIRSLLGLKKNPIL